MSAHPQDKNLPQTEGKLLDSLAKELKNPLILIARQAELERNFPIRETAEKTLQLIDSYLLVARAEYGQLPLSLETVGIGSVVYEVERSLSPYAKSRRIDFKTEVKAGEVIANREGLKALVWCLCDLAMAHKTKKQRVRIMATKDNQAVSVAVVGSGIEIKGSDIEIAKHMQGRAHLAAGKLLDSGVRLAIADMLAASLGSSLKIRQVAGLRGLGFELKRSTQLRLV